MQVMQILKEKGAEVTTIGAEASIADAVRTLNEKRIGALVITDRRGDIEGILSERDLIHALAEHGTGLLSARVVDLMTRHVFTCTPETSIEELMRQMTRRRIRHLPVLGEGGRLCGIVSIGDVVKNRLLELETEATTLRDYIGGR
jgi:CBS domain-containing protein